MMEHHPLSFFVSLTQERKKIQQNKGGPDHLNACIHDFFLDRTSHFFYNAPASRKPFMRAQSRQGFPGMSGSQKKPDQIRGLFFVFPFF
jgi:hypothetical protein